MKCKRKNYYIIPYNIFHIKGLKRKKTKLKYNNTMIARSIPSEMARERMGKARIGTTQRVAQAME